MPDEAKELIEQRHTTAELHGFRSRAGKSFRARLKLDDDDKVVFDFPELPEGQQRWKKKDDGEAVAYALFNLQERGRMFVSPGEKLYEGMIIGIHSRENDLVVNPIKTKKLTNIRAAGKDDAILLTPPIQLTLEYAVEFIADDELVEVTPESIRIRKRFLKETDRKRTSRKESAALTA